LWRGERGGRKDFNNSGEPGGKKAKSASLHLWRKSEDKREARTHEEGVNAQKGDLKLSRHVPLLNTEEKGSKNRESENAYTGGGPGKGEEGKSGKKRGTDSAMYVLRGQKKGSLVTEADGGDIAVRAWP